MSTKTAAELVEEMARPSASLASSPGQPPAHPQKPAKNAPGPGSTLGAAGQDGPVRLVVLRSDLTKLFTADNCEVLEVGANQAELALDGKRFRLIVGEEVDVDFQRHRLSIPVTLDRADPAAAEVILKSLGQTITLRKPPSQTPTPAGK